LLQTGQSETRDRIVEIDFEQKKSFVIAKTDVVPGLKLLDQSAFEQERFRFIFDYVNVEIMNGVDERIKLEIPTLPAGGMKILRNAAAQIARFADVNDRAEPVLHQVDARFVRHRA